MDNLSAGRKPGPLHDVGAVRLGGDSHEELLRDLLIRMTERPHLESLTEVLRLALHR
jgi:hypothetical protein